MTRAVDIEGRGVRVNGRSVGVGSAIPDSAVAHGVADDYDGSQWVADIGPNVPDANGNPSLQSDTVNGSPVVRYNATDSDASQTTTSIASADPQAIYLVASLRDPSIDGPHTVDSESADGFAHQQKNGGHRLFRGGSGNDVGPQGSATTGFAVYCLEGYDGNSIRLLINGSEVVSGSAGSGDISGLTFAARGDFNPDAFADVDIAEYTVTEAHTTHERDAEIDRLMSTYSI